jgi:hypothetical protein
MCKANWPTQRRPTEAERATLERVATRGLEGEPPWEEAVVLPRVSGAGTGNVATRCKDNRLTDSHTVLSQSQAQRIREARTHLHTHHPEPPVQWHIGAPGKVGNEGTQGSIQASFVGVSSV